MKEKTPEFCCDKLVGRIIEKYKTRDNFASKVPISIPTLINKLNGTVDFKRKEIFRFCELLDISLDQIPIFFYEINLGKPNKKKWGNNMERLKSETTHIIRKGEGGYGRWKVD